MKRLALLTALLALSFAASAQTPATTPAAPADPAAAVSDTAEAAAADKLASEDKLADRNCLRETGSRVIRADSKGRKCAIGPGRSYTKEDIDRTGSIDLADALRKLDPSIR
jgi:phosphate-selective porin